MTREEARLLQRDLMEVFDRHGVDVAVGLTQGGIAILAQQADIQARHIGYPAAYPDNHDDCDPS